MPWKETKPMDERVRFIGGWSSDRYSMSELCRIYGISRKTGYKWAQRYEEESLDGLKDRSRRPARSPRRTEQRCVEALLAERRSHPRWGARKLLVRLRRQHPDWSWPSASTAAAIFHRHGLVEPRRRRLRGDAPGKPSFEAAHANDLWTADFKGHFRTRDRIYCYPLTVTDNYSRYILGCQALPGTLLEPTKATFTRLFKEHGLPRSIKTDNGVPFSAPTLGRLSQLSVWWLKLGVMPVLTQPGKPQQNGRHERMHKTLKDETLKPPAGNSRAQLVCRSRQS